MLEIAGLKDFVPLALNDGYEGFEDLNVRFNIWLKEHSDILVTNVQSVIVQRNAGKHQLYVLIAT